MSDYLSRKKKFEKLSKKMTEDLKPIFDRLIKKSDDYVESHNAIDTTEYNPACGITKRIEPLTPEEVNEYERAVETTANAIKDDPFKYKEISGQAQIAEEPEYGEGKGTDKGRVRLKKLPFPSWLRDIKSSVKDYFDAEKGRTGMDYEEAVKGVIRKAKGKIIDENNALYVLLDTSGSMWGYTDAYGNPLLKIFSSHFPAIANEYKGQIWMVDDAPKGIPIPNENILELEDFTKDTDIVISGGGGTSFWGAFEQVKAIEHKMKKQNSDAKVTLMVLTDMGVDLGTYPELIPESVIFVTLQSVIDSNYTPIKLAKKYIDEMPDTRKLIGIDAKEKM